MTYIGTLQKMLTENANTIQYYLVFKNEFIAMNQTIGKTITITHTSFECLNCGANKKIFRQGFCYDCFTSSPAVGEWIIRPELSTAHLDIEDRDLDYEKKVQLQPHIVYLSLSSEIKVGVTRKTQVPTRWIDQGAVAAIPVVEVPNRYLAGITEIALKEYFSDKTNWQKMLKNDIPTVDLVSEREKIQPLLPEEIQPYFSKTQSLYTFNFPVEQYPTKIKSLNLNKTPTFSGKLKGIKGQYLIFEDNTVFNVRSYEGYVVTFGIK